MALQKKSSRTLKDVVRGVIHSLQGPTPVADVLKKIKSRKTGNPSTIHSYLREEEGCTLIYLDQKNIIQMHEALQGLRFRINLCEENKLDFCLKEVFYPFLPFEPCQFQFVDSQGKTLPTSTIKIKQKIPSHRERMELEGFSISTWFPQEHIQGGDSILVAIEQYTPQPVFRLEYEPAAQCQKDEICKKNKELADVLFDMLENEFREDMLVHKSIVTAYCRLKEPRGYPGDHWFKVLEEDGRMRYDGFQICYAESKSFWDEFFEVFGETDKEQKKDKEKLSPEQKSLVYRFKVSLHGQPATWRCIELQGKHTLADFDGFLRNTFHLDIDDHLSGFWRLIPRGRTKRFRQIDLAVDIDPFGEGEGVDLRMADLKLAIGDQLKYVYDFGDWIEYRIILEETMPPNPKEKYPRVANKTKTGKK